MKTGRPRTLCFACAALFATTLASCGDDGSDPPPPPQFDEVETTPYIFELPAHFPPYAIPEDNPTTKEGIELGRRLYYDSMLSKGGPLEPLACASCHLQAANFTTPAGPGIAVMSHVDRQYETNWLWNGKVEGTLEDVMLFEVGDFFVADATLFEDDPTYQQMTYDAFGTRSITRGLMAKAMAQFLRTLNTSDTRYDRYLSGETDALSEAELRGLALFEGKGDCASCHELPLTFPTTKSDDQFQNNGLVGAFYFEAFDRGRYNATEDPADYRKFKIPSLRNIELSPPYMHDGRFETLMEVIEHYDSGVEYSATLSEIMTSGGAGNDQYTYKLDLSPEEKDDLLAFLLALTDTTPVTSEEYSSPF